MEGQCLGLVHAMGQLSEYAVHVLHYDAEQDDEPALHQHGPLRSVGEGREELTDSTHIC